MLDFELNTVKMIYPMKSQTRLDYITARDRFVSISFKQLSCQAGLKTEDYGLLVMVQMMLSTGNDGNTTIIINIAKMEKIQNNSPEKK